MDRLNDNELEVLRVLWAGGPKKPPEIQSAFGRPIDNGTLRSVLVGMVEQGLLHRRRQGRAYVYRPRVRREAQFRRMIGRLAEVFNDGSTGALLMELAEREKLGPNELARLREIAGNEKETDAGRTADERG